MPGLHRGDQATGSWRVMCYRDSTGDCQRGTFARHGCVPRLDRSTSPPTRAALLAAHRPIGRAIWPGVPAPSCPACANPAPRLHERCPPVAAESWPAVAAASGGRPLERPRVPGSGRAGPGSSDVSVSREANPPRLGTRPTVGRAETWTRSFFDIAVRGGAGERSALQQRVCAGCNLRQGAGRCTRHSVSKLRLGPAHGASKLRLGPAHGGLQLYPGLASTRRAGPQACFQNYSEEKWSVRGRDRNSGLAMSGFCLDHAAEEFLDVLERGPLVTFVLAFFHAR